MRKKLSCLLLSGALALTFAACAFDGEEPAPPGISGPTLPPPGSSVQVLATPSPEPEASAPPAPEEPVQSAQVSSPPGLEPGALPDRDYQPWQAGYMEFLTALLRAEQDTREETVAYAGLAVDDRGVTAEFSIYEEPPLPLTTVMSWPPEDYCLYDVDKDGVPELFVRYGTCEADFTTQCYTWRDGQIVCIGEFRSGHSALYTCPGKSAVLRAAGHMGYAELYEYPMEGGRLTEEREIFSEEDVQDYTPTDEIVPGAEYIESYYTWLGEYDMYKGYAPDSEWSGFDDGRPHTSGSLAMVLPICDWYDGPAATGDSSETARTAILAALNGETKLYGASGDHFYGDIGWTTWEEYIQPGAACPYNDDPLEVIWHAWMDMNGDGQEELLLKVVTMRGEDGAGEDGDRPWTLESAVMLSEQEGTVYAYFFGFYDDAEAFYDDGTVRQYGQNYRLSFWKNQCYQYIARRGPSARPVKWADGSPAG